ncbi:hypothetical protein ACR820_11390 [Streptomyces netropsis]
MATLSLFTLSCHETSDAAGGDEAFINVDGQRIFGPVDIDRGQTQEVGFSKAFTGQASIDLFDAEGFGSDFLGNITVRESEAGQGRKVGTFRQAGAHYTLAYEVGRQGTRNGRLRLADRELVGEGGIEGRQAIAGAGMTACGRALW